MAVQMPTPPDDGGPDDDASNIFAEVNITPLTDVVFVLLIIFMVSSSAVVEAVRGGRLEVKLPKAGGGAAQQEPNNLLVISVLKDGRVALGDEIMNDEELSTALKSKLKADPATLAVIDADGGVEHQQVVRVLDLARQLGFANVGIGVSPE